MYSDKRFLLVVALVIGAGVCTYLKAAVTNNDAAEITAKIVAVGNAADKQAALGEALDLFIAKANTATLTELSSKLWPLVGGQASGNLNKVLTANGKAVVKSLSGDNKKKLTTILDKFSLAQPALVRNYKGAGGWNLN